jgi:hypothetical protein
MFIFLTHDLPGYDPEVIRVNFEHVITYHASTTTHDTEGTRLNLGPRGGESFDVMETLEEVDALVKEGYGLFTPKDYAEATAPPLAPEPDPESPPESPGMPEYFSAPTLNDVISWCAAQMGVVWVLTRWMVCEHDVHEEIIGASAVFQQAYMMLEQVARDPDGCEGYILTKCDDGTIFKADNEDSSCIRVLEADNHTGWEVVPADNFSTWIEEHGEYPS